MTIAKSLSEWLKSILDIVKIDTEQIGADIDSYGLYRSPDRQVETYNDDSYALTEYYQFFAKQSSQTESDRLDNDEWLENVTYTIDDKNYCEDYPVLDNNRVCIGIELNGQPYTSEAESSEAIYAMTIKITYLRKRDVEEW